MQQSLSIHFCFPVEDVKRRSKRHITPGWEWCQNRFSESCYYITAVSGMWYHHVVYISPYTTVEPSVGMKLGKWAMRKHGFFCTNTFSHLGCIISGMLTSHGRSPQGQTHPCPSFSAHQLHKDSGAVVLKEEDSEAAWPRREVVTCSTRCLSKEDWYRISSLDWYTMYPYLLNSTTTTTPKSWNSAT